MPLLRWRRRGGGYEPGGVEVKLKLPPRLVRLLVRGCSRDRLVVEACFARLVASTLPRVAAAELLLYAARGLVAEALASRRTAPRRAAGLAWSAVLLAIEAYMRIRGAPRWRGWEELWFQLDRLASGLGDWVYVSFSCCVGLLAHYVSGILSEDEVDYALGEARRLVEAVARYMESRGVWEPGVEAFLEATVEELITAQPVA